MDGDSNPWMPSGGRTRGTAPELRGRRSPRRGLDGTSGRRRCHPGFSTYLPPRHLPLLPAGLQAAVVGGEVVVGDGGLVVGGAVVGGGAVVTGTDGLVVGGTVAGVTGWTAAGGAVGPGTVVGETVAA